MDFYSLLLDALTPSSLATLGLLVGLELVLGIDNVLLVSIVASRLPEHQRDAARNIGLFAALAARLCFVAGAYWLVSLTQPIIEGINVSWKDVVLVSGGLFLIWKAVKEIHHVVEGGGSQGSSVATATFGYAIGQIVLLDMVFSLDSVITAVGMTPNLVVIATAVIASFAVVLTFAKAIGDFIIARPALKILALSFLVTIGITICLEGMHKHVDKAYIYLPMGFALAVELLQLRHASNTRKNSPPKVE